MQHDTYNKQCGTSFTLRDLIEITIRTMDKAGKGKKNIWKSRNIRRKKETVYEQSLPWDRGRDMEWLKRNQMGSRNQQHRGHWGWTDLQQSSSDLQDRQSSCP